MNQEEHFLHISISYICMSINILILYSNICLKEMKNQELPFDQNPNLTSVYKVEVLVQVPQCDLW
jgi:hypothetical protein